MYCSVGHSLHSRINQQGKKLVITGFIQNVTSREFLGGKGSLPIHSPLTPQLQNRIIMVQFSSVAQSCPTLCDPMNRSTPGLSVHHQFPEFTQTHVHWIGDAIQPSHPLSSPFPPAPNPSPHQSLFQWVNSSHEVAKVLEFQLQRIFRTDFLYNWLVWSPCSPRDSQKSSPTPQFKSINSLLLRFLYSPTITSIHDYWKKHNFDYTDLCWQSNTSDF